LPISNFSKVIQWPFGYRKLYLLIVKFFFMRKVSIKNWSLLGLVLMAASAVTAAVLPNKSDRKITNNGTLRNNSGGNGAAGVFSCIPHDTAVSCTANTATNSAASLDGDGKQTVNNTSRTTLGVANSVVS
jgi:hypothetical protein